MANNKPTGIAYSDPDLQTGFSINGAAVNASGAELNTIVGAIASVTTAAVPATGSCSATFTFKDNQGNAPTSPRGFYAYLSDVNGVALAPITSIVGLAGTFAANVIAVGSAIYVVTNASGVCGLLLTGSAGNRYITFISPNGKLLSSGPIVIN